MDGCLLVVSHADVRLARMGLILLIHYGYVVQVTVNTGLANTESRLPSETTGSDSWGPLLVTTLFSTNQCITLVSVYFWLNTPYWVHVSFKLNSQQEHCNSCRKMLVSHTYFLQKAYHSLLVLNTKEHFNSMPGSCYKQWNHPQKSPNLEKHGSCPWKEQSITATRSITPHWTRWLDLSWELVHQVADISHQVLGGRWPASHWGVLLPRGIQATLNFTLNLNISKN